MVVNSSQIKHPLICLAAGFNRPATIQAQTAEYRPTQTTRRRSRSATPKGSASIHTAASQSKEAPPAQRRTIREPPSRERTGNAPWATTPSRPVTQAATPSRQVTQTAAAPIQRPSSPPAASSDNEWCKVRHRPVAHLDYKTSFSHARCSTLYLSLAREFSFCYCLCVRELSHSLPVLFTDPGYRFPAGKFPITYFIRMALHLHWSGSVVAVFFVSFGC